jgi:hypothetical protein
MVVWRTYLALIAAIVLSVMTAKNAQAAYVVTFKQIGANVVELGSGALDTTNLIKGMKVFDSTAFMAPFVRGFESGAENQPVVIYGFLNGPSSFGPNGYSTPSLSDGDAIGIRGDRSVSALVLSPRYVSGRQLTEFSVYDDASFASLGMIPGLYVWSWGSGAHADTFSIDIIAGSGPQTVPELSTWAMMLLGFAGLGYAAVKRKGAGRAASA